MKRKLLYKIGAETTESLRQKRRFTQNELRKEKREMLLSGKRMRVDDDEMQEYEISEAEVLEATVKLTSKSGDRQSLLKLLRQAFAQGTGLIDQFLSKENSLTCLVGLFTGHDLDVQLEAAWCLTNISAGTDDHANAVIKCAGPYLITYLSSGNHSLQDQCAWAVGNLAGGSASCRQMLRVQGALSPLVDLLHCPASNVVQSAAFALSNLAKDEATQKELVTAGIIPILSSFLVFDTDRLGLISEVSWVLTYLSASGVFTADILSAGILQKITSLISEICNADSNNFTALTPLLRCLGNIACKISDVGEICQDEKLFVAVKTLFQSKHLHIQKESLWVISNISVFESACDLILAVDLLPVLVSQLASTFHVRKEAAFALCNIATHGQRFCSELHRNNVLPSILPLLKSTDAEACHLALSLVEMILHFKPEQAAKEFEECHGLDCLEALEYSSNDTLRTQTNDLLETYFYKDDDDDS